MKSRTRWLGGCLWVLAVVTACADGPPAANGSPTGNVLRLSVTEAILMALENNPGLLVQRLNPALARTREAEARSVFEPTLSGEIERQRSSNSGTVTASNATGAAESAEERTTVEVSAGSRLPTGTRIDAAVQTALAGNGTDHAAVDANLTLTQPLLDGFGTRVNLASLRQARLDTHISVFELRGFAESLVAEVEKTYWDCVLTERQLDIYRESLRLAEEQLKETTERIRVGKLPEIEAAAAEAEVSLRRESLINAESAWATACLRLIRLLQPPGGDAWSRGLRLEDRPAVPLDVLDSVDNHVALALQRRPDINQAQLALQRGELEVVKTRNGLLPRLDLFIALGRTGYADSFADAVNARDGEATHTTVGVRLDYSILNWGAKAGYCRALLSRQQGEEALRNVRQLAEADVRMAYIEARRATAQVAATAATRRLQEAKLHAETEKFRVGKSTSLLVAQAQRDLLESQVAEIQAVVKALQARVELYRLEGSLLDRRGVSVPTDAP